MDINNIQDPNQAKEHANNLQSQIEDLHNKANNSEGQEKQGIMVKIESLKQEKAAVMNKIKDLERLGQNFKNIL